RGGEARFRVTPGKLLRYYPLVKTMLRRPAGVLPGTRAEERLRPYHRAVRAPDGRPTAGILVFREGIARRLLLVDVDAESRPVAGPHAPVADLRRAGEHLARFVAEEVLFLDAEV